MIPLKYFVSLMLSTVCSAVAIEILPPRESRPPTITPDVRRKSDVIYFSGIESDRINLPCRAYGSQPISFEWEKNGEFLDIKDPKYLNEKNHSRIISMSENTGTLTISEPLLEDEGTYQCFAINKFGKSLSKKIHIIKATIGLFNANDDPKTYTPFPATSQKINCNPPKSHPPAKIKWVKYKNDGQDYESVDLDDRIAIDNEGNLFFANIQENDNNFGEQYACLSSIMQLNVFSQGAFSYIEVQEGDAQMTFPAQLLYSSKPDNLVGLRGQSVTFKCIFGGNPTPTIRWERKGDQLDTTRMIEDSQKLTIRQLRYDDAGQYQCIGSNPVQSQERTHTFTLTVESKPEWLFELEPVEAGVDEMAKFKCIAQGEPTPVVEWFINGRPIDEMQDDSRRTLMDGEMTFTDLSLEKNDPQVIQCNASNKYGYKWADVALTIQAYKPEIMRPLTELKVAAEQDVMLPCEVDAKPRATVFWERHEQKLSGARYIQHPSGNLTIKSVDIADQGDYTCTAYNKYGRIEKTGKLIVRQKTTIVNAPIATQYQKYGKRVMLTCSAHADINEEVTLSWFKDGEPVDFSDPRFKKDPNDYLIIENMNSSDTGNYTCKATTSLDSASKNAEIKVIAPPDPPFDVSFKACRARNVVVTWKPGRNNYSPITHYIVQYNHSFEPGIWREGAKISDPNKTQVEITISPWANYTFRVISVNKLGESLPSERSRGECMANEAPPDKHPDNVHTIRNKPGWLIVTWDRMPEIEHNGEEFRYVLSIKHNGMTNKTDIHDWKDNRRELDYGLIYEQFEVYVEAHNKEGTFSDGAPIHIGYTGEAEPLVNPQNFEVVPGKEVMAKSATFQWDPVDDSPQTMRGEFHGYKIVFWNMDDPDTENFVLIEATSSKRKKRATKVTATVNNLIPFSELHVQVFARNTYFTSNGSNIINITTPEGVPGPVKFARILLRGAHHFLLEWGKPEVPNGILTGYAVGYREIDGLMIGSLQSAETFDDPDKTNAYLGGLSDSKEYRVYVWALTSSGRGEEYIVDGKTTKPGPLETPLVTLAFIGETFVNVSWSTPPNSENPAGSQHFIKIRKAGASDWIDTEKERLHSWLVVTNLTGASKYEIRIVATNGQSYGHGDQSSPIKTFTTKGTISTAVIEETSIAQTSWFIGMMVALAVLIVILIVVCFIKRSRGEKYHVQERERLRGTDPEAQGPDNFNEYPKSAETDPLAGSPDSFDNEPEKGLGGSETDSMAEYGDVDPSKFNEDGSFIGQYGNQKSSEPNAPSAMSTFV